MTKTILIIEDDSHLRTALCRLLERAGYRVLETGDGDKGIRSWLAERPDLVIVDIHMPDKDGIETILELLRKEPAVKMIAISGGSDTQAALARLQDARRLGALRTILKPFTTDEVLRQVRELIP